MLLYKLCKLHANFAASFARTKEKRRRIRTSILKKYNEAFNDIPNTLSHTLIFEQTQNFIFPINLRKSKKIMLFLLPEHNAMSGGIYSIVSITQHMRRMKALHGYDVILMTRPNKYGLTYVRNTNFINSENIFRFEQINNFKDVKELYIHIPEYASKDFLEYLTDEEIKFLLKIDEVHINILNQNITLMPDAKAYQPLRKIAKSITQSVAHHAYFNQEIADKHQLPTLFLPAYTDITHYQKTDFASKSNLIIYSLDKAPFKEKVLNKIKAQLPQFKLLEIKDITFDEYMEHATKCMFSISFGEGFDGYIAQPIYQGGLGLTVYNDDFFPSDHFKQYPIFFNDSNDMIKNICKIIEYYSNKPEEYNALNAKLVAEYDQLYSYDEYIEQLKKLAKKQFELFPSS